MIKSMTGYGRAKLSKDDREYQIEIKSVNHRYLDISVRIPKQLSYLEETIKKEIAKKVKRGKIDVFVTFENNSLEGKEIKINTELAQIYIQSLRKLAEAENLSSNIEVTEIAKFPDILTIKIDEEDDKIKEEIIQVTQQATEKIIEMKNIEGKDYLHYEWIDLKKIDEYKILPKVIKEVLKEKNFPAHKINNELG